MDLGRIAHDGPAQGDPADAVACDLRQHRAGFADVIDDFVLVRYLSGDSSTEPVSVKIYNTARAAPTPALNALATLLLVAALLAVTFGYLLYRRMTRGDHTTDRGIAGFAGEA